MKIHLDDRVSRGRTFGHHGSVELAPENGGVVVDIRDVDVDRGDGAERRSAAVASLHRQEVVSAGLIVQGLRH